MNSFELLCKLASEERWCWNLHCSTCGHMHFKYSFMELAKGKQPYSNEWLVHQKTKLYKVLGSSTRAYTTEEKNNIIKICIDSSLSKIAKHSTYPDWLGYVGLVLAHTKINNHLYIELSSVWANQLKDIVEKESTISLKLQNIVASNTFLSLKNLEECQYAMQSKYRNNFN